MLQDKVVYPSLDVKLFGRYIAPALNITTRLVGEEPFDRVTAQYNNIMQDLLPEYGIKAIEVPRYKVNGKTVSATEVRKLIKLGDWKSIKQLLPKQSYNILKQI